MVFFVIGFIKDRKLIEIDFLGKVQPIWFCRDFKD